MHKQNITIIKTITINTTITPRPGIRRQIAQTPDPAECRPRLARDIASHAGYGSHHALQAARQARCVRTKTQSGRPATDKNKIRHARHNAASDRHQIRHTRQNAGSDMHQIARHACQAKRPCRQGDWRQHRSTLYSVEIHDVAIHTVAVLAQAEFDLATGISH